MPNDRPIVWRVERLFALAALVATLSALLTSPLPAAQAARSDTTSPVFELRTGERYFRIDGAPAFVVGRNPVGVNAEAFAEQFQKAAAAGERFVRIHFTYSPAGEKAGEILPDMLKMWDAVLDAAEKNNLAVLPVLGIWSDWNDGSHGEAWHLWKKNPFNAAVDGPAKRPGELLEDTECRKLWFKRLETMVKHWAPRRCIVGWEIFSEVDLITGATEDRAVDFAVRAAAIVQAADPVHRPTALSQAGINAWPKLLGNDAVQIVSVHPYAAHPFDGNLDELILKSVRERLQAYRKPVLIGECGLDWAPPRGTLDVAPGAEVGIRHAIWASVVSGAMSGRMLWWQDGWDQFEMADVCRHYEQAAAPAAAFVKGIDFTDFAPVACDAPGLMGATLGNDRRLIGWFRDVRCVPPQWLLRKVRGREVTLGEHSGTWQVEFVDTTSGRVIKLHTAKAKKNQLKIPFPTFQGSIALRACLTSLAEEGARPGPSSADNSGALEKSMPVVLPTSLRPWTGALRPGPSPQPKRVSKQAPKLTASIEEDSARVEEMFRPADQFEVRPSAAPRQVDALAPSVLARAFSGRVFIQNPNDEPAPALLERVAVSLTQF